jgi:hypothetical protein
MSNTVIHCACAGAKPHHVKLTTLHIIARLCMAIFCQLSWQLKVEDIGLAIELEAVSLEVHLSIRYLYLL